VSGTVDRETRHNGVRKARSMALICLCFLGGAVAGAVAAPRLHNFSFWLVEPVLLTVLVMSWWQYRTSADDIRSKT
jgi:uncharacterized membrane protein YoaK (UPF0700 family)